LKLTGNLVRERQGEGRGRGNIEEGGEEAKVGKRALKKKM